MWQGKRTLGRGRVAEPPTDLPSMEANFPSTAVEALRGELQGSVVLAGDDNYHLARQGFVVNYQAFPQIIVYCQVARDVAMALAFARRWQLSPVCRSGGH